MASEVIEHVPDPKGFCRALTQLAASPGAVVVSTLNRTPRAYALAIGAAEYLLGWVPRSTHDWNKFVTPGVLTDPTMTDGCFVRLERLMGSPPSTHHTCQLTKTAIPHVGSRSTHHTCQFTGQLSHVSAHPAPINHAS